jgi:hypothetical protein
VVSAVGAGELHASLDASDCVETFHRVESSLFLRERKTRGVSSEGNARGSSTAGTKEPQRLKPRTFFVLIASLKRCAPKGTKIAETPCEVAGVATCKRSFDCGCPSRWGAKDNPRSG